MKSLREVNMFSTVHMRSIPHVFDSWGDVAITGALELDGRYAFGWLLALEYHGLRTLTAWLWAGHGIVRHLPPS